MPVFRTFISLPTQPNVQQAMADIQTRLKETQSDVKWDLPDKFHITLKFLGNVEPLKIELLSTALVKSVVRFPAIEIQYDSLGVFPNIHNPCVIWIGIKPNYIIQDIQLEIDRLCQQFGFSKEERAFHPHITLGRVKGNRNFDSLTDAIKTITFEPIESRCNEVLLMKSDLKPSGSVYTILKSFPLNNVTGEFHVRD